MLIKLIDLMEASWENWSRRRSPEATNPNLIRAIIHSRPSNYITLPIKTLIFIGYLKSAALQHLHLYTYII